MGELTEEEAEARRAMARRQYKLRKLGRPSQVSDEEFAAARHLLSRARACGMDDAMINRQMGLGDSCASPTKIREGRTSFMLRSTYNKIMQLKPEEVVSRPHDTRGKVHDGATVDPTGTQRRLQALRCDGFSNPYLASVLGVTPEAVSDMARMPRAYVYFTTRREVRDLYDKLDGVSPSDVGVPVSAQKRMVTFSKRAGHAPRHCWDPDTIDDPKAIPEWTGACGTAQGAAIHQREGIPLCQPCREFRTGHGAEPPLEAGQFSGAMFKAVRLSRGFTQQQMEHAAGLAAGQSHHWESGRNVPRAKNLAKALSVLDATFEDVCQPEEEV